MAEYWVDPDDGSNANAGTSVGAAWLTITYAIDNVASSTVTNTIWLKPSLYKELVTGSWPTNPATALQTIRADRYHQHAWTTAPRAGALKAIITNYLTDFLTATSSASPLTLATELTLTTWKDIHIIAGGSNGCVNVWGGGLAQDTTFDDCIFDHPNSGGYAIRWITDTSGVANTTFNRCRFSGGQDVIDFRLARNGTADTDENIVFNSCIIERSHSDYTVRVQSTGAGANYGGGVVFNGCDIYSNYTDNCVGVSVSTVSTTYPVVVKQCRLISTRGNGLNANTSGQITSDENFFEMSGTEYTNVTGGSNDIIDEVWCKERGLPADPEARDLEESTVVVNSMTTTLLTDLDYWGRPRLCRGPEATPGAVSPAPKITRETSTVPSGETSAIKFTGAGWWDIEVPVDASETTLSVEVRHDTTYTGTMPSIELFNGAGCGVSDDSDTSTSTDDAWDTLTVTFTPTSAGIVTIRYLSEDTSTTGASFFGMITVS